MTITFADILDSQSPGTNSRRAALMLHSLPAPDRDWVLVRLSESQRQALERMLSELRDLDVPPLPADELSPLLSSSWVEVTDRMPAATHPGGGRIAEMISALRGEPARFVDAAIALQDQALRIELCAALARPTGASTAVPIRMARSLQRRLGSLLGSQQVLADFPAGTRSWRLRVLSAWRDLARHARSLAGIRGRRSPESSGPSDEGASR